MSKTIVLCNRPGGCCPEIEIKDDAVEIRNDVGEYVTFTPEQFELLKYKIMEKRTLGVDMENVEKQEPISVITKTESKEKPKTEIKPKSQQEIDKSKEKPVINVDDAPKVKIEAFHPSILPMMQMLQNADSAYRGMRKDEEQRRVNIVLMQRAIKEVRARSKLTRQVANGLMQEVTPEIRQEIIKNTTIAINNAYKVYLGVIEQRKHRGDELGEARIKIFRILGQLLNRSHGFTQEELISFIFQKPNHKENREMKEIDADIKKTLDAANQKFTKEEQLEAAKKAEALKEGISNKSKPETITKEVVKNG